MEKSSNLIYPGIGIPRGELPFDNPETPVQPVRQEGETPGERKQIARDIRNAIKKEKKLAKADAKRQRKLNAIVMTKNPEEYVKNKERNRIRALDQERAKIQNAAIRQAERLAAKHDPSGKTFNVGEVVVLEDGSVKSKEALKGIKEQKAEREAEKAAKENSVNSERAAQIQGFIQEAPKKRKISKRQQKKQGALEGLQNRPPPPRPVLPEGVSVPEGEENFIALWDIADEEIHRRMSNEKRIESSERKDLRRRQKEEKRYNQAMKLLKRQTENRGKKWDPEKGRAIVLKLHGEEGPQEDSQDSGSDDDSEDEEIKAEDLGDEDIRVEEPVEPVKVEKESKKSKQATKASEPTSNGDSGRGPTPEPWPKEKKSKRPTEDDSVEEPKAKKRKKSKKPKSEDVELVETPILTEPEPDITEKKKKEGKKVSSEPAVEEAPVQEVRAPAEAEVKSEEALKEEKRSKKAEKRAKKAAKLVKKQEKRAKKENKAQEEEIATQENELAEAAEAAAIIAAERVSKKRKHEAKDAGPSVKKEKSHKKKPEEATNRSAEQWNPDVLTGDAARKEKFLRLLGAGKSSAAAMDGAKHKSSAKLEDITKVQSELERQYDAGMRMKHDGGAKRRGLGA